MMLLIMNPGSCAGRGRRLWPRWEAGLRAAGIPYEPLMTRAPGHAAELARNSAAGDIVVAVGGDGTISEVLDGVVRSGHPDLRMGVLYAGTSPDFCRFHGLPLEPAAALRILLEGRARRVDVGEVRYTRADGTPATACFGCGCNVGLGPAIARRANRLRRFLGDAAGTGLSAVSSLFSEKAVPLAVDIDGYPLPLGPVNNLSILKSGYIASGLRADVGAEAADGLLRLVAVHGQGPLGLCALLPKFYSGGIRSDAVVVRPCRTVTIRAPAPTELEFDGDPRGFLPAEIRIRPRALNLIGAQS